MLYFPKYLNFGINYIEFSEINKCKKCFYSKKYEKKSCGDKNGTENNKNRPEPCALFRSIDNALAGYDAVRFMFDGRVEPAGTAPNLFHNSKLSFPLRLAIVSTRISIALRASRRSHIST